MNHMSSLPWEADLQRFYCNSVSLTVSSLLIIKQSVALTSSSLDIHISGLQLGKKHLESDGFSFFGHNMKSRKTAVWPKWPQPLWYCSGDAIYHIWFLHVCVISHSYECWCQLYYVWRWDASLFWQMPVFECLKWCMCNTVYRQFTRWQHASFEICPLSSNLAAFELYSKKCRKKYSYIQMPSSIAQIFYGLFFT